MPEDKQKPDYISTIYSNLKQANIEGFNKTEDEFRNKVNTDFDYRKTVHANLKNAYGDNFKKDFTTFNFNLPSIESPAKPETGPGLQETTIEDFDRAKTEIPKTVQENKDFEYNYPRSKNTSSMPSETTQQIGGVYRAIKAKNDEVMGWDQKQKEPTSQEVLLKSDPDLLHSDIKINSSLAGRLFSKQPFGPDAVAYGKYLMNLKNINPEKYEEKVQKLANHGLDLDENERYNEIQDGLNGYAAMLDNDKSILKARGGEMRLKETKKINGKLEQLSREINSYGSPEAIPEDKKIALKAKYDEVQQQKDAFDSNPENKDFLDKYDNLFNSYGEIIKGQNKLILDSPSALKRQREQKDIKRQEELIEGDLKNITQEDVKKGTLGRALTYQEREAAGNVWNTVTDNAVGLLELWKDIGDTGSGYSVADRLVDKTKSFVDSSVKATISDTDLFDEKGNMRWYRFGPNLAKIGTDMAIMLAPVGRLKNGAELLKMGKYADEAAAVSSQFATTYDDYKKDALAHGMSSNDAEGYGLAAGLVTSLTAAISPNEAILNPGAIKGSLSQLAERYVKQGITGLTKREGFSKLVSEMTDVLKTGVKESAKEAAQENAESVAEKIINIGYNANDNKNPMSKKLDENISREEFLANTIFSAALAGPSTIAAQAGHSQQITDGSTFELLKNYDESQKVLNQMRDDGRLSDDAYNRVSGQLEKTKEIYDKIPAEWSDTSKQNIIPFLREKVGLEERISKLDKNFSLRDNKRLDEVNKTLDAFNEKESGIEAAEAISGDGKKPIVKAEKQVVPEDQTQYDPLNDNEVDDLKNGSPVSLMQDGKKVDAKVDSVMSNGEIMLEIGSKKKIVLASSLIKEKPQIEVAHELNLSDEELKTLHEETNPDTKQQKESSSEPGSEGWNLAVKNRLEKVFKGSELSFDQKEFDAAAESSEHNDASNSTGFYDPKTNKLFLNPKKVKKDTPIHEFGHIWTDVLKEKNPKAYEKALQLSRETDFYKEAESNPNYSHLSNDALAEEAFVTALGKKGVDVFSDIAHKNAFSQFMTDMWDHIKDALGLSEFKIDGDMSFTDLVNKAAEDLGKNKTVELKAKEEVKPVTEEKFKFDPESGVGKKVKDFVSKNIEAGIKESDIKKYLKEKIKLSDDAIKDVFESAKKPVEEKPTAKPIEKKSKESKKEEPKQEDKKEESRVTEKSKVKQEAKINDKIVDLSRVPVNSRVNTVLSRILSNPETPSELKDELTRRFGSKEQMLKSNRYSQKEARQLGAEIVKSFDKIDDAIDFATNKGYQIDGDIQAAILDNVISDAYDAEKKAKTDEDKEYYKGVQAKALDEIASAGEQAGRKVSYYNMMYNVNPVIFGEKMAEAISDIQSKVLDKKLGDSAQNSDEKIDQFAKESEDVVNREKKKAATSEKVNQTINGHSGPKYKGPKTTKTSKEISDIRKSRNAKMEEIKKKFKGSGKGPEEKFAFEESESQKLDESRLAPIKEIGDTFIDEGYITYTQWARKVQNEFKDAGIDIHGKELKEVWGRSKEKVDGLIKEAYKNLPEEDVESLIKSQASEKIKEQNQAIRDILADATVSNDMKDKINNRLINELGLSDGFSSAITDSFMSEFETQARKQVESKLRQIRNRSLISSFVNPNKESEQRIVTDILNGTFDGEKLKPAFYEAYGMTPAKMDQGLKDRLINLSRKVSIQKEGSLMKDKALRDLYNEISKYKPTSLFNLGTDVYYSSLLSGYETHIKNFALFNAMQVYINKPMQIAMQDILAGNKSKAATAIYSKELAKTMFNEAKGIVLTGTNSFYEKAHEQSALEKFTKSPGKNPLKFLWRYANLPTRMLQAEDAFGTIGLTEARARQLMYSKIKNDLENKGEMVDADQINDQVNKALGYTKETAQAAKLSAEQSLKNYYGDDFNLKEEMSKPVKTKEDKLRKERIKTEYVREIHRSIISQRNADVMDRAMEWSKTALLQNDPEGTLGRVYVGVQALINQIPALRLFVPFLKVPLNVTNNLIQSTPGPSYVRLLTGKKGTFGGKKMSKEEYREHAQKAITYTLLTAALAALQEGLKDDEGKSFFYVTGKNGKSYTETSEREVAGIDQPYTVYVGGKPLLKYQYTPWMPLFTSLGIYNDIKLENNGEIPEGKDVSTLTANAFIKYANTINEQAALKGMNEIINVVQEGYDAFLKGEGTWDQKVVEFAQKKAASTAKSLLVPNAATQANTDIKGLFDVDRIGTTSFMDDIIKDMPIVDIISQQYFGNESKIDILGRPIKEKFSVAGYDKTLPASFGLGKVDSDLYYKMFVDKHYLPYSYGKKSIKIQVENPETGEMKTTEHPLSLNDRYRVNKLRGDMLLQYMNENMDDLKQMDDESFKSNLKSVISSYDQQVEQQLFNPDGQ